VSLLAALLLWPAGLPSGSASAQDAGRPAGAPVVEAGDEDEPRRLTAWPEPRDAGALALEVRRLRDARTEEMAREAAAALIGMRDAAAPALLAALGKERSAEGRARITAVLDGVTGAPHTRLLAALFADRALAVRVYSLRRAAAFPDAGVRAAAEAALGAAREKGEKGDPEELLAAALCATTAGSLAGLDVIEARAREDWKAHGVAIRAALESVRGPAAAERAARGLDGERGLALAALHLLAGCGTSESAGRVARFLDESDHALRLAAINALRGIVDGAPPHEKLPVFDAIEEADRWRARLR